MDEQQKADIEKRIKAFMEEQEQKRNGTFYKVDDENKLITYDPNKNNHGETDNNISQTISNMIEIAGKTGYTIQAKFNDAQFKIEPGMTSEQSYQAYYIALRERYRDANDPHFQINFDLIHFVTSLDSRKQHKVYYYIHLIYLVLFLLLLYI